LTKGFSDTERFGLASQINRASISIPANIAEGLGRRTQGDFERHLRIAVGSAAELHVLLDLSSEVLDPPGDSMRGVAEELDAVRRKLNRLIRKSPRSVDTQCRFANCELREAARRAADPFDRVTPGPDRPVGGRE
jgi:four helix bundle protein